VGLVADDDRVGVGDLLVVADEPLVGLDRDRSFGVVAVAEQRRAQPLLVAAVGDLADELVDEVAAVGEDEDAAGAGGLDETDGGHGLAGAGRVLEPEAALGPRVLGGLLDHLLVLVDGLFLPVLGLLVGIHLVVVLVDLAGTVEIGTGRRLDPVAVLRRHPGGSRLLLAHQLGQRAREGIDLVRVEFGAVAKLRRLVGEEALQPQQQREVPAPLDRGVLGAFVELLQRAVQSPAPRRPRRQRLRSLAVEQEGLAGECRRTLDIGA
jgi:hypothetical protein